MGDDWCREDTGFTEEERALIAMRELRALDPLCPICHEDQGSRAAVLAHATAAHGIVFTDVVVDGGAA